MYNVSVTGGPFCSFRLHSCRFRRARPKVKAQNGSQPSASESGTVCTFADGQQLSARHPQVIITKDDLPRGKAWSPADQGIYLFSEAELQFAENRFRPARTACISCPALSTGALRSIAVYRRGSHTTPVKTLFALTLRCRNFPVKPGT